MTTTSEKSDAERQIAFQTSMRTALVEYGKASIAGVFTLNGGAVIATMTLAGTFAKRPEVVRAISGELPTFLAGLVLAAAAWLVTYLSFVALDLRWSVAAHRSFSAMAWVFTAASLGLFVCGCWRFRAALLALI